MEAPLRGVAPKPRTPQPGVRLPSRSLPAGAVPADPRRQPFGFRAPKLFYVDRATSCRGCGVRFVLTARDQKRWCETLGLKLDARAALCRDCRREFLRENGLRLALADASLALSRAPFHAPAVLAYARAAVALAERFGDSPLDSALAALATLEPAAAEALYLAGRCHELAGRPGRAAVAFRRFLAAARARRGFAAMARDADARLRPSSR